jgi:hypothetical protein
MVPRRRGTILPGQKPIVLKLFESLGVALSGK